MVTIETLRDGLGAEVYRVSRIFPNAASAMRAEALLKSVTPEAFVPAPVQESVPEPVQASHPIPDPEKDDDEGEPYVVPGCANGLCGMD